MVRTAPVATVPLPNASTVASTVASTDAPTVPATKRLARRAAAPPLDPAATSLELAELALDDLLRSWCQPHGSAANSAGRRTS